MATRIRITDPQMTALECAGVFEVPEPEWAPLLDALRGQALEVTEENLEAVADVVNDLSNHNDVLGHSGDLTGEPRVWARKDARVLSNLYSKILKERSNR